VSRFYGEVLGYGMSGDAHHITQPAAGGGGAARAMEAALRHAEVGAHSVDYVNVRQAFPSLAIPFWLGFAYVASVLVISKY
jgi:3-oxoacyl-[acyl-carrier-protein] synthase II